MSKPVVRLAISTCPNDTFAFAALLENRIDTQGVEFQIELLDIEQLNNGLSQGRFDVAKASFYAALQLANETIVLPVGSALGFGVGPLLLSRHADDVPLNSSQLTLCPGEQTTAKLLFDLFYPQTTRIEHVVFSDIMPALSDGRTDFGVCIHEGRFTYQASGLYRVADLGERWETKTGCPLPLGGLLARRQLDCDVLSRVCEVISGSLEMSQENPESALPAMRRYAQSMQDDVLMKHVDLYVNDWTVDLGETGRQSLFRLSHEAREAGLTSPETPELQVF